VRQLLGGADMAVRSAIIDAERRLARPERCDFARPLGQALVSGWAGCLQGGTETADDRLGEFRLLGGFRGGPTELAEAITGRCFAQPDASVPS